MVTNSFTRAIDQLGATRDIKEADSTTRTVPNLEVRLGALFALERLYRTSEADRPAIAEIIAAYVREHAGPPPTLAICKPREDHPAWSDSYADALEAWYRAFGEAFLQAPPRADLQAALAILCRSCTRSVHEPGTDVDWSTLNTSGCDLRAAIRPGLRMSRAALRGLDLSSANMEGMDLSYAKLAGARLHYTILNKSILTFAFLEGAKMQNTNLEQSNMRASVLYGASLRFAKLRGADLSGALLQFVDLSAARLDGAKLEDARIIGSVQSTRFDGAILWGADLSGATYLTKAQIDAAWEGDGATLLPPALESFRPVDWPKHELGDQDKAMRMTLHRAGHPPPSL